MAQSNKITSIKESRREREKRRTKSLNTILGGAQKYREAQVGNDWENSLKWFKGDQYMHGKTGSSVLSGITPSSQTDTVTNLIFAHIMTMVPFLSNRVPSINTRPINAAIEEQANELGKNLTRMFLNNDVVDRQEEMVLNGALCGKGYWKMMWDDQMRMGDGDIKITTPDTRRIFLEPGKMSVYEANYIIDVQSMDKLTMLRMYPDRAEDIKRIFQKPGGSDVQEASETAESAGVGYHAAAPGEAARTTSENYLFDTAQNYDHEHRSVELVEIWFHDEGQVEIIEDMVEGVEPRKKLVAAYPTGRLIVFAGDVVLVDRPNPYTKFPFIEYFNYDIPGMPYAMNEPKQLLPLQYMYNKRNNQLFEAMDHAVHRNVFFDHRANLNPDEISNESGQYIPVDSVDGIRVVDPPGVPNAAFNTLDLLRTDMEYVSGVNEVTRGSAPGDVRSGYAIEQLQSSSANRMKMKTRSLERAIREASKLATTMMGMYYEQGTHYHDTVDLAGIVPHAFDYQVRAGVNLPPSRASEQQFYQWMYGEGIVDEKFIVDHSDIADKMELIERVKPMWEAKRQERMGAGQQMTPPGMA